MQGVTPAVDLFSIIGIDPVKEKLYTAAIASIGDAHNGLYWAIRTVDQDAPSKRWDVRIVYVAAGGTASVPYWFQQGHPELPHEAGAVALALRSDGKLILTVTENTVAGALFPPKVIVLDPVG